MQLLWCFNHPKKIRQKANIPYVSLNYELQFISDVEETTVKLATPMEKNSPQCGGMEHMEAVTETLPVTSSKGRGTASVQQKWLKSPTPVIPISLPRINKMQVAVQCFYLDRELPCLTNHGEHRDYFFQLLFIRACHFSCIFQPLTPERPASAHCWCVLLKYKQINGSPQGKERVSLSFWRLTWEPDVSEINF